MNNMLPTELKDVVIRPEEYRWRVGRSVGRTIYIDEPGFANGDILIGMMDTPALAEEAVRCHNIDRDIRASR